MGFLTSLISLVTVLCMVLLIAFMYSDILDTKHEIKQQLEKMDRLRKEVEKERKKDSNDKK